MHKRGFVSTPRRGVYGIGDGKKADIKEADSKEDSDVDAMTSTNESPSIEPRLPPSDTSPQTSQTQDEFNLSKGVEQEDVSATTRAADEIMASLAKRKAKEPDNSRSDISNPALHTLQWRMAYVAVQEGKDVETLNEEEYTNLAYRTGQRAVIDGEDALTWTLSNSEELDDPADPKRYAADRKAATSPAGRAYVAGYNAAKVAKQEAEGSFYDTAEFRGMFGNVLKGMEERGEKWEEDGIAEMDAEADATQSKQGQITKEQEAQIEATRLQVLNHMARLRREKDTKEWQELEEDAEEKARWAALTEKERNTKRVANAKAAKKKAAKEAAEKKVEEREMKRQSREQREARVKEESEAKMEREAATLAKAVEEARKNEADVPVGDSKLTEMKGHIARLAIEMMKKELETSEETDAEQDTEESTIPNTPEQALEAVAKVARNEFGDTLPEGLLDEAEYSIYQRLYGSPSRFTSMVEDNPVNEEGPERNKLLRQVADGSLEEVDYILPDELDQIVDDDAELEEEDALIDEQDDELADIEGVKLDNPIFTPHEGDEIALTFDEYTTEQEVRPLTKEEALDKIMNEWPGHEYIRTHALTRSGRYGTNPSTLPLPRAAFINPVQKMLAPLANKHLAEAAQKSLGGLGIPLSPNTPRIGMRMEMQPIPLTSFQSKMSDREADVYMSAVMPQTYASLTSILVEVRKRLGASWLQNLLNKEGGPLIMDAGAGGAGVIAWRELLRAEWEGMHKVNASEPVPPEDGIVPEPMSEEPKSQPVPFGKSTVVTGSDPLRHRISKILQNTTFIPRIPDQVDPHEHVGPQPRKKYDLILASHTLWPIKEEYQRKGVIETLWSLLNPDGGILIIMEKGVPRGFEVVAGARQMLLKRHIASPGSESYETPLDEQKWEDVGRWTEKEKGCIIAPCTNHSACPLYRIPGVGRGRKDWCYFSQRYTRPPALMAVLGAKARNHDDVEYSYVAVQRGVDQRTPEGDSLFGRGFVQGVPATAKALNGYGPSWSRDTEEHCEDGEEIVGEEANEVETSLQLENIEAPHPLSLPRTILAPLKRKGNVLIDVCTPSGTFERWLVNKRNGRQIFRDARKAKWGDLWALGARSATERRINVGVIEDKRKEGIKKDRKAGRKGLGKRGKGRWADGDGGKMGMGRGGKMGRGRDGAKKSVVVGSEEEEDDDDDDD
ncbi:hypothetical protein E2P81_ATG09348 [Venturia nashicola]|uniref:Uncharacterized protein n=1 Tax=Venturia nashicola TaxID=86259 RepID=A0A4Z1P824_9PEZI|nr:hypothetical protein E6O75_ATG09556 [Venturia nashicola]TLD25691.1 hypothetical protein E2P81_ATG09348 [Venturia nashicola]